MDLGSIGAEGDYLFLVVERPGGSELETARLDGSTLARVRAETNETWHLLSLSRTRVAEAHPLLDPTRAEAVELDTHPRDELEDCGVRGVLEDSNSEAPVLLFEAASLGGALHTLDEGTWQPTEFAQASALSDLAVRVPIRKPCEKRHWRPEPFFDESPIFEPGRTIREFEFGTDYPRAMEVRGLVSLPGDAYLVVSVAALVIGRAGEPLDFSKAFLALDLPPPPAEWSPTSGVRLVWEFGELHGAGTSSTGEARFFARLVTRERGNEQVDVRYGGAVIELFIGSDRVRVGNFLHLVHEEDGGAVVSLATLGDQGGVAIATSRSLLLRPTANDPLTVHEGTRELAGIVRTELPGAEIVIALEFGGFLVGDPRDGFAALRFEATEPGSGGCARLTVIQAEGAPELVAGCNRRLLLARKDGDWPRVQPWFPRIAGCNAETLECGRPTFSEARAFLYLGPGPGGDLMLSKEACPATHNIPLFQDQCAREEVFDTRGLVVPSEQGVAPGIYGYVEHNGHRVVFGRGGLLARVMVDD